MAKYRFEDLNNGVEIIDPGIEINPVVKEVNPIAMTISVDVVLTVDGAKLGIRLNDVAVVNLTYTAESLEQRVMEKLEEFIVE